MGKQVLVGLGDATFTNDLTYLRFVQSSASSFGKDQFTLLHYHLSVDLDT